MCVETAIFYAPDLFRVKETNRELQAPTSAHISAD